jgi:hypothetical protein
MPTGDRRTYAGQAMNAKPSGCVVAPPSSRRRPGLHGPQGIEWILRRPGVGRVRTCGAVGTQARGWVARVIKLGNSGRNPCICANLIAADVGGSAAGIRQPVTALLRSPGSDQGRATPAVAQPTKVTNR